MDDEAVIPEAYARRIMETAISTGRSAEVIECLLNGGSVTIDVATGQLLLATADQLAAMGRHTDADPAGNRLERWVDGQIEGIKRSSMAEASRGALNAFEAVKRFLAERP